MTYPPLYPHLNRICSCHYLCLGFWQLQTNRQRPSWLTGQTLQLKPYCAFCLENPSHFSLLHSFLSLSDAVFPYLNITKNKWNIGHSHFFLFIICYFIVKNIITFPDSNSCIDWPSGVGGKNLDNILLVWLQRFEKPLMCLTNWQEISGPLMRGAMYPNTMASKEVGLEKKTEKIKTIHLWKYM